MPKGLTLVSEPTTTDTDNDEPVSLSDMKGHLRVTHSREDNLINAYIRAARRKAESFTRRAFITQTWKMVLDSFPGGDVLRVPKPPLQSLDKIEYILEDGTRKTFDTSRVIVDTDSLPGRIHLDDDEDWPTDELEPINGVEIHFIAGYGNTAGTDENPGDVPDDIRQAIKLNVGHLYENRESVVLNANVIEVPETTEALLWPYRYLTF